MDPISDMFIRLKNAKKAEHESVTLPYSKYKYEILKLLAEKKWVGEIDRKGKKVRKTIEVVMRLQDGISDVKMISKPSRRLYASYKEIPSARRGGVVIVSTSRGIMTGEDARKAKVGGQLIAEIW